MIERAFAHEAAFGGGEMTRLAYLMASSFAVAGQRDAAGRSDWITDPVTYSNGVAAVLDALLNGFPNGADKALALEALVGRLLSRIAREKEKQMSAGHIRPRGKGSWELKFDAERDPATGKRKIQYVSFRGTKRGRRSSSPSLIAAVGNGGYVEPSKLTVAEHVRARINHWEPSGAISARTAQRYHQLSNGQIAPHIGAQASTEVDHARHRAWHTTLRTTGRHRGQGGVAPRTVVHAHRVLSHALDDAVRHGVVSRNVARLQPPPRVDAGEMAILDRTGFPSSSTSSAAMPCMRQPSWPCSPACGLAKSWPCAGDTWISTER